MCGRICDSNTALILLATRVLLASPNFRQAKHCQKGPAATFPPKGDCSPMYTHLITFYGPLQTISLFVFKLEAKQNKISIFHKFASPHTKFVWQPAAASILIPPTLHIACLNRYTPKVFRGSPIVDPESIVCLQGLPKVR